MIRTDMIMCVDKTARMRAMQFCSTCQEPIQGQCKNCLWGSLTPTQFQELASAIQYWPAYTGGDTGQILAEAIQSKRTELLDWLYQWHIEDPPISVDPIEEL